MDYIGYLGSVPTISVKFNRKFTRRCRHDNSGSPHRPIAVSESELVNCRLKVN